MTGRIQLRQAAPQDAGAIAALTRAAYAKWVLVTGREPLPMTVDYGERVTRHRFDLLIDEGALAGLIETAPAGDELLIENVAVAPVFQGRGLGRRLLAHAEGLATAAGLTGTRLYTNQRFSANLRLYASLGYGVEREEALNGGVAVHMVKRWATTPERAARAKRLGGYFDLTLRLAGRMAELTGLPLGETTARVTNLHRLFGFGRPGPEGPAPAWSAYAEGLERIDDAEARTAWTQRFFAGTPQPPVEANIFGCFRYDPPDDEGVVRIHFSNREADDGCGPLAAAKRRRRMGELAAMFAEVEARHSETRTIRGGSWLYNLEAYRRLFPPAYVASRRPLQVINISGTSTWGQVLDYREQVRPAVRAALIEALPEIDPEAPWLAFPLRALTVEAPAALFFAFYRAHDLGVDPA
jgi:ribosomal protein S18 acetylase RimI-like enzyme